MDNVLKTHITGQYKDTIRYADGRVEVREGHNLVVDGIYKLITSLLSNKSGYKGLGYWAIGEGLSSWNSTTPPSPSESDTRLTAEIGRVEISASNMVWLDESNEVSSTPTNKLRVRVTFGNSACVGSWREFGIFGGDATSTRDSGIMINHKTHGLIVKTAEMEIEREIIFTFSR